MKYTKKLNICKNCKFAKKWFDDKERYRCIFCSFDKHKRWWNSSCKKFERGE